MKEFPFIEGTTASNYIFEDMLCRYDFSFFTPCKESNDVAVKTSFILVTTGYSVSFDIIMN